MLLLTSVWLMAMPRIYSQLFVSNRVSVPADEERQAVVLLIDICNFTQQQVRSDDFQLPPHRSAEMIQIIEDYLSRLV